jgi:hypothetical protein
VPVVKPDTVIGEDAPVPVSEPGEDVTVNDVAAAPEAEGVNVTDALVDEACEAVPIVGALGCRNDLVFCELDVPIIGIWLFYLTLVLLIVGLTHT